MFWFLCGLGKTRLHSHCTDRLSTHPTEIFQSKTHGMQRQIIGEFIVQISNENIRKVYCCSDGSQSW